MQFKTTKAIALLGTAIMSISAFSTDAQAQTQTVNVNITTASGITTTVPDPIDYGTWLVIVRGGDTPTITVATDGTATTGGITTSTLQNLSGTSDEGGMTVDLPDGTTNTILQMSRTAPDGFTPATLNGTITAVTYGTTAQGENTAFPVSPATVPVTVASGATPEAVRFGSTITFTATPTSATYTDTFDVSFAY